MSADDFAPSDVEASRQCAHMLALLKEGPQTTLSLRAARIAHPAGRAYDLRRCGVAIITRRQGRFALYALAQEPRG